MKKNLLIPSLFFISITLLNIYSKNIPLIPNLKIDSDTPRRPPLFNGLPSYNGPQDIRDSDFYVINHIWKSDLSMDFKRKQLGYFIDEYKNIEHVKIDTMMVGFKIMVNNLYQRRKEHINLYKDTISMEEDLKLTRLYYFTGEVSNNLITRKKVIPSILKLSLRYQNEINKGKIEDSVMHFKMRDSLVKIISLELETKWDFIEVLNSLDYLGYVASVKLKDPYLFTKSYDLLQEINKKFIINFKRLLPYWHHFAKYNAYMFNSTSYDIFYANSAFLYGKIADYNYERRWRGYYDDVLLELIQFKRNATRTNIALKRNALNDYGNYFETAAYYDRNANGLGLCYRASANLDLSMQFPKESDSSITYLYFSAADIKSSFKYGNSTLVNAFRNGEIANIMEESNYPMEAAQWVYNSYKKDELLPIEEMSNFNAVGMFFNLPMFLYKSGYEKQAEDLYEFLSKKSKFNLYISLYQLGYRYGEKKNYKKASEYYKQLLDTAEKYREKYQQSIALNALITICGITNDSISYWKYHKKLNKLNETYYVDNQKNQLLGISYAASAGVLSLKLSDTLDYYSEISQERQNEINLLNSEILIKQKELDQSKGNLVKSKLALDSLQNRFIFLRDSFDYKITEKKSELARAENNIGKITDLNERLEKSKDNAYLLAGIIGIVGLITGFFAWFAFRQKKKATLESLRAIKSEKIALEEKNKAQRSEAKERILSRTMYQLGHLGPQSINNVIQSIHDKSQTYIKAKLSDLSHLLRNFYDYSKAETISYENEYDLIIQYSRLAYSKEDEAEFDPKSLIEINYYDYPNVLLPTFVMFNAVQNAFKHGNIDTTKGKVSCDAKKINNEYQFVIKNDILPNANKIKSNKGTGLKFINSALQYWNKDYNTDFLFTSLDEKNNTFTLEYTLK